MTRQDVSTVDWIKQGITGADGSHARVVQKLEEIFLSTESDALHDHQGRAECRDSSGLEGGTKGHNPPLESAKKQEDCPPCEESNKEPVNILVFDGGGLRGYALCAIGEIVEEIYGEEKEVLDYFDLLAGTSVGGDCALICHNTGSLKESILEGRDGLDDIRENTFSNLSLCRFLFKCTALKPEMQIRSVMEKRYGCEKILFNPESTPTMVLCSMVNTDIINSDRNKKIAYEPFVLRTYTYPGDEKKHKLSSNARHESGAISDMASLSKSSHHTTFVDALAATSAVPGLVDRIKVKVDETEVELGDGGLICNSPVAIAIDEARKLYPTRPLGIILNFGFDHTEQHHISRTIQIAKRYHPNLHFQRVVPPPMSSFSVKEKDLKKVALMEKKVRQFLRSDNKTREELDATMKRLFDSKNIEVKKKHGEKKGKATFGFASESVLSRFVSRDAMRKLVDPTFHTQLSKNNITIKDRTMFQNSLVKEVGAPKEEARQQS